MKPIIFDSVGALLEREALGALLDLRVRTVEQRAYNVAHLSGNELQEIWIESDAGRARLILKQFHPESDWVMRLTHDVLTREAMLFTHGIYARMPREIVIALIAVARVGESWATLMRDVSAELLPTNQRLRVDDARLLLEHLAALHAHFWKDATLQNPALGLSTLQDFLTILSPARIQAELDAGRAHPVLEMAARGWVKFFADASRDVSGKIRAWQENPAPLLRELETMPQTLLHGDFKLGNVGISRTVGDCFVAATSPRNDNPRTIVLDWQDATRGAGVLDLGYFLALNARWLPFSKERAIEIYTDALATRGFFVSAREIEIGLLAGGALRLLWLMISGAQKKVDWWYDLIRRISV